MELFFILAWWVVGVAGFIFWWTSEFNFRTDILPFSFLMGILGPLAWAVGYYVHNVPRKESKVLIKKRKG